MTSCALAQELHTDVPFLSAIARRLCGNRFDADDLVQDTLERALRARSAYVEQGNRRGWLATILRNRFRDRCRSAFAQPLPSDALDQVAMPEAAKPASWEHITTDQITDALQQLEPAFRGVYERHANGSSYAEIAGELGISINTVGTRLLRARSKLKVILDARSTAC
jgi:RNA polymerase sigma-70 factor, ECF subfamily